MNAADTSAQRDRRLHTAGGRVEVVQDRRDRHVHQRRVEDEHEHRHREEDREQLIPARLLRHGARRIDSHEPPTPFLDTRDECFDPIAQRRIT
jgi:hypothetical protein